MGTASRDDEAVRRHLATCEACAKRLMHASQLESDLYDAAAATTGGVVIVRARPAPAPMWRVALPVAAALAAVAFGTWSLISRERPEIAHQLPAQEVCRCVTVELSQGPPMDPGGSDLCTPLSAR